MNAVGVDNDKPNKAVDKDTNADSIEEDVNGNTADKDIDSLKKLAWKLDDLKDKYDNLPPWIKSLVVAGLGFIGLLLVSCVISFVSGGQFWPWSQNNLYSDNIIWSNIKDVLLVAGYVLVVVNYWRNSANRKNDVATKRFETTMEAERFFRKEILTSMRDTKKKYEEYIVSHPILNTVNPNEFLTDLSFEAMVEEVNFSDVFQKLNYLSSYTHYKMVNKKQLYSNISDEINQFESINDFKKIEKVFNATYFMNNYLNLINDINEYIERREIKYGQK